MYCDHSLRICTDFFQAKIVRSLRYTDQDDWTRLEEIILDTILCPAIYSKDREEALTSKGDDND